MSSKKILIRCIELVTLLIGAFGGFLLKIAPPDEIGISYPIGLSSFLLLFILLLITSFSKKYPEKKFVNRWYTLSISCFLIALVLSFTYYKTFTKYTFNFPPNGVNKIYLQGNVMTKKAIDYIDSTKITNIAMVVADFGGIGSRDEIWEEHSIKEVGFILLLNYVAFVVLFITSFFLISETNLLSKS